MRFGEYVRRSGVAVAPVDRFAGFVVDIGGPPGWELVRSVPGMWVWCDRDEMFADKFCANTVLTMHCVEAALDEGEVFAMLVDEQLQSVPGSRAERREIAPAGDGVGVQGFLALQTPDHEFGAIGSVSRFRIVRDGPQTMIAQLTVTALLSSSVNWAGFELTLRPSIAAASGGTQTVTPALTEPASVAESSASAQDSHVPADRGTIAHG